MKICVLVTLLLLIAIPAAAQVDGVESVTIESSGPDGRSGTIEIKRGRREYQLNGRGIPDIYIRMLLDQIEIRTSPSPESAGLTKGWLENRVETFMPGYLKKFGSPAERDLWARSFTDLELVGKIFPRVLAADRSDRSVNDRESVRQILPGLSVGGNRDESSRPRSVVVVITKQDGSTITVRSAEQTLFMFPNPRLGKAIAALMPAGFANREFLNGNELPKLIAAEIENEIAPNLSADWRRNRIESQVGKVFPKLRVDDSRFEAVNGGGEDLIWHARIGGDDASRNVVVDVSFPFRRGNLVGFDRFVSNRRSLLLLAGRGDWFWDFVRRFPDHEFVFSFGQQRIFPEAYGTQLLADLRASGNAPGVVRAKIATAFLLTINERPRSNRSRWLIFPDGKVLLWDFTRDSILAWASSAVRRSDDPEDRQRHIALRWYLEDGTFTK